MAGMKISRRTALSLLAAGVPAIRSGVFGTSGASSAGFQATRESLQSYRIPDWFRDAKFGIWAHWGPQSATEAGDWYARNMYIQGERQYKYHVEHYGHPSKFGFKDIIPTWKGERFDPDYLVGLYKKAGAKYFVSMGVHHDNFDLWNSKHNPWNAVQMGPKKDIVGMFRQAALKHGLRFGVSDHLWISYKWWAVSHMSDKEGPMAGVPYDGANPRYESLYHHIDDPKLLTTKLDWDESGIPDSWKRHYFLRIKDLIDQYQPDYVYSDGHVPFGQIGLDLLAHYYNQNAKRHGGNVEAVYMSKRKEDCAVGTCVLDSERGVLDDIRADPWQTDTCIGNWHYLKDVQYKTPKMIVDLLADIVSRNGNLMLNFPLPGSGMLDDRELKILDEITRWMTVNGEAIYGTRPWKIFGEGPNSASSGGAFSESKRKELTAEDVRFTSKGDTLYVFVMGWPQGQAVVRPLAAKGTHAPGKISQVKLLGFPGELKWQHDEDALRIALPATQPCDYAVVFKLAL